MNSIEGEGMVTGLAGYIYDWLGLVLRVVDNHVELSASGFHEASFRR